MGKASRSKSQPRTIVRPINQPTHEPPIPRNWPEGHVSVELTMGSDVDECFKITIHGVDHYLHASTTQALREMLVEKIEDYNELCIINGVPTV